MDKNGYLCPEAVSKHSMQINTKQISRCPAGSCAVIGKGERPNLDFFRSREEFRCLPARCTCIQTSSCCLCQQFGRLQAVPLAMSGWCGAWQPSLRAVYPMPRVPTGAMGSSPAVAACVCRCSCTGTTPALGGAESCSGFVL